MSFLRFRRLRNKGRRFGLSLPWALALAAAAVAHAGGPPPPIVNFAAVEGATVVANNGRALGTLSKDGNDDNSLWNVHGRWGNEHATDSLFNDFGPNGSKDSLTSAFNPRASAPPKLWRDKKFVAYLSQNPAHSPRLDSRLLMRWILADRPPPPTYVLPNCPPRPYNTHAPAGSQRPSQASARGPQSVTPSKEVTQRP